MPSAERAVIDPVKLTDYCLNPDHPRGRHKARVFESALGLTSDDADELRQALLDAALDDTAELADADDFGQRYVVEFAMNALAGTARIRSAWIVRADEDFPRFVSCYVI
ncbi:MAG: hypothetical protein KDA86_10925 [Planctomycetaceae bacterium]|nr:hypothetical protein [Planctomycetaceae bacterium]